MMAVHWVAGRLFTPSGVTKRVGQFVVGLHLVRRSRSVGPGTDCVGLFPGGRLRRLARAWARRRGGRLQSRVSSRLLCGPCASRWGMSESGQGSARRDGACPKVDKGLRVAMGHVRKWTRVCAPRWGMSESGQGSARGGGAFSGLGLTGRLVAVTTLIVGWQRVTQCTPPTSQAKAGTRTSSGEAPPWRARVVPSPR